MMRSLSTSNGERPTTSRQENDRKRYNLPSGPHGIETEAVDVLDAVPVVLPLQEELVYLLDRIES
jgi:hypothetical protein